MLYRPIYRPYHDERRTNIECDERLLDLSRSYVRLVTLEVELPRDTNEHSYHDNLEDQRRLHERVAHVLHRLRLHVWVREDRNPERVEALYDGGDGAEGGECAARVERRKVRHIIEDPAEDVVVCEF